MGGVIFGHFSNVDNFRPEVYREVMSGVVIDPTAVKIRVKFGYSRLNLSRYIRLPHFVTNDYDDAGRRTLCHGVLPKNPDVGPMFSMGSLPLSYGTLPSS